MGRSPWMRATHLVPILVLCRILGAQGAEEWSEAQRTQCMTLKAEHSRACKLYGDEDRLCTVIGAEKARACQGVATTTLGEAAGKTKGKRQAEEKNAAQEATKKAVET